MKIPFSVFIEAYGRLLRTANSGARHWLIAVFHGKQQFAIRFTRIRLYDGTSAWTLDEQITVIPD